MTRDPSLILRSHTRWFTGGVASTEQRVDRFRLSLRIPRAGRLGRLSGYVGQDVAHYRQHGAHLAEILLIHFVQRVGAGVVPVEVVLSHGLKRQIRTGCSVTFSNPSRRMAVVAQRMASSSCGEPLRRWPILVVR